MCVLVCKSICILCVCVVHVWIGMCKYICVCVCVVDMYRCANYFVCVHGPYVDMCVFTNSCGLNVCVHLIYKFISVGVCRCARFVCVWYASDYAHLQCMCVVCVCM